MAYAINNKITPFFRLFSYTLLIRYPARGGGFFLCPEKYFLRIKICRLHCGYMKTLIINLYKKWMLLKFTFNALRTSDNVLVVTMDIKHNKKDIYKPLITHSSHMISEDGLKPIDLVQDVYQHLEEKQWADEVRNSVHEYPNIHA